MPQNQDKKPDKISQAKKMPKPTVDKLKPTTEEKKRAALPVNVAKSKPVVTGCPENFKILHRIVQDGCIIEQVDAVDLPGGALVRSQTDQGVALCYVPHISLYAEPASEHNGGHYLQH